MGRRTKHVDNIRSNCMNLNCSDLKAASLCHNDCLLDDPKTNQNVEIKYLSASHYFTMVSSHAFGCCRNVFVQFASEVMHETVTSVSVDVPFPCRDACAYDDVSIVVSLEHNWDRNMDSPSRKHQDSCCLCSRRFCLALK